MNTLPLIDASPPSPRRLPPWLKRPLPAGNENFLTHNLLRELGLETVCENARCPNRPECYARRTATFMILGNICTRPCGFCSVPRGVPEEVEADEPERVARHLHQRGVAVTKKPEGIRVATHFFNDESDIARLIAALAELRG